MSMPRPHTKALGHPGPGFLQGKLPLVNTHGELEKQLTIVETKLADRAAQMFSIFPSMQVYP